MLRIVFMGSDAIALPGLNWLAGEGSGTGRVVAVFTQPDRPVGRGQKIQPNAIKLWAQERGLPVHQPERFSDSDRETLAGYAPDLSLVMAYGHILRQPVIDTPRLGTVNLHASLLPGLRGASPIQTAVASGAAETGVAFMRIVPELDAGPVAEVERVPIGPLDTALDIEARLGAACAPLLARTLSRLAEGSLTFVAQDPAAATFCRKLEKADGVLDFARPARELAARINGLFPWPATVCALAGEAVKFGLADSLPAPATGEPPAPGFVVGPDAQGLLIGTGDGLLRVRRMQRPGGRMLEAAEFLRGFPLPAGTRLASLPMPELVSPRPFPRVRK